MLRTLKTETQTRYDRFTHTLCSISEQRKEGFWCLKRLALCRVLQAVFLHVNNTRQPQYHYLLPRPASHIERASTHLSSPFRKLPDSFICQSTKSFFNTFTPSSKAFLISPLSFFSSRTASTLPCRMACWEEGQSSL